MIDFQKCIKGVLRKYNFSDTEISSGLETVEGISSLPLSAQIIAYGNCLRLFIGDPSDIFSNKGTPFLLGFLQSFDEAEEWGFCADKTIWNGTDRPIEDVEYWSEACLNGRVFLDSKKRFVYQDGVDIVSKLFKILNSSRFEDRRALMYESIEVFKLAEHIHQHWDIFKDNIILDDTMYLPDNWDTYSLNHVKVMINKMIRDDNKLYEELHKVS